MVGFARHRIEMAVLALILVVVVAVPFTGSRLALYGLTITALYATVVVSLNLLLGLAGQVSFAQTSFMAIGGYGSALLTTKLDLDPWLAMLAGAGLSLVGAAIVGGTLLRLRGHYLSMATFALALGTFYFATAATWLTNGAIGISGVPPLAAGPISFDDPVNFYALSWLLCALVMVMVGLLANSYVGRAWRALATSQDIAQTLGINVTGYKLLAFCIAAVVASIAGSFYVEFTTFVGPDLYDVTIILNLLIMLFVGGRGSTVGPIVGAAVVILVPQMISGLEQLQNLAFFTVLLVLILVRPAGLFGHVRDARPLEAILPIWLRRRRSELP